LLKAAPIQKLRKTSYAQQQIFRSSGKFPAFGSTVSGVPESFPPGAAHFPERRKAPCLWLFSFLKI